MAGVGLHVLSALRIQRDTVLAVLEFKGSIKKVVPRNGFSPFVQAFTWIEGVFLFYRKLFL